MHRLLTEAANYPRDLARSVVRFWQAFFFSPADPTSLGLIRIAVGCLLFWNLAVLGIDLHDFLGTDGWIGPEAARQYLAEYSPRAWSFWLWVPDRWLWVAWGACLVVAAMFAAGFWSRTTAVLAWIIAISTVRRAPVTLYGFDHMLCTWISYLAAFGASGQALSVDRLRSRARSLSGGVPPAPEPTVSANLALRLIQLHLALVYGSAGLSKLMAPEWWNGTAMEMIVLTPEFRRFNLLGLFSFPLLMTLATHLGLLLEITYPVLVWLPKLRPLVLASAILMHASIDLVLGLTEFGLAMMAASLAFVPGAWMKSILFGPEETSDRPEVVAERPADPGRPKKGRREPKPAHPRSPTTNAPVNVGAPG